MAVITVQGAPRSSKRVAILGECLLRCDRNAFDRLMSLPSLAAGVGHPVEPLAFVVRADSISSQNRRRSGVAFTLKRQGEFVPPSPANRASNLFSKDHCRAALPDEANENWRKMPPIALAFRSSICKRSGTEWLAWGAPGPQGAVIGDAGEPQADAPSADSGEEVA